MLSEQGHQFGIELVDLGWEEPDATGDRPQCETAILCSMAVSTGTSAVISPIVIVVQFISGVCFVYSDVPPWMQQIAALLPLKWLTQGMRSVFLPDSFATVEPAGSWEHGKVALVLIACGLASAALAMRTFRWHRRTTEEISRVEWGTSCGRENMSSTVAPVALLPSLDSSRWPPVDCCRG